MLYNKKNISHKIVREEQKQITRVHSMDYRSVLKNFMRTQEKNMKNTKKIMVKH